MSRACLGLEKRIGCGGARLVVDVLVVVAAITIGGSFGISFSVFTFPHRVAKKANYIYCLKTKIASSLPPK